MGRKPRRAVTSANQRVKCRLAECATLAGLIKSPKDYRLGLIKPPPAKGAINVLTGCGISV